MDGGKHWWGSLFGSLCSGWIFLFNVCQLYFLQVIISCTFSVFLAVCWPGVQSARDNHVLACNFTKYSMILKKFTHRLSNEPFLIWLLITQPHLKYVAALSCNLSLMACFADINVSQAQGSVETCARCGGTINIHLTPILPRNLPVKKIS